MSKNDIEPVSGPIWPLATQSQSELALAGEWGQRSYGGVGGLGDLNLATIFRIVSEWRWLILGAAAVAIAGAIGLTFLTTPKYRATAILEINPPAVEILENSKSKSSGNDQQFLATQYGLLASKSLAERVAQELNLASNEEFLASEADRATRLKIATGILMANFEVDPMPGSRLVKIAYSSPSAGLAAQITNSFADNFINSNLERRYEASSYARQFLERQIATIKGDLEKSERQLVAYAQQQGIINTSAGASIQGGPSTGGGDTASVEGASLLAINQALAVAQARRIAAEQRYQQMRRAGTSTAEVTGGTANLRYIRSQLEAEYQDKLASFKPDYPDMVRLRTRIEGYDRQINREAATVAGGSNTSLLAEYHSAVAEEQQLQAKVGQLKGAVLNLRGRSIKYNILQREVDTNRSLYDALLQRYKEIGVAGGIGTNTVSIVDAAEAPGAPYTPNLVLNILIGLLVGLLGGIAAALAIEFVNDTVKTPDDVRDKLRLASLGVIPKKTGEDSLSDELKEQSSAISEAYFSLRTSLQFTTDTGAPKSLLITSTRAAEGKSSTTLALAQNFARLGNSVLLIDADLRKPAFVTGLDPKEGLSKLLTNTDQVHQHVLNTQVENLSLMPCGPLPPNPAELLASLRLKAILAEAMNHYDMVIVDGPPVLGLADAPLLSGVCKGTLLVVESGKTRTKAAIDAINRLKSAGSHIVGAVLTKYRHQSHTYGYGYEPYKYGGIGGREREIKLVAQREA